MLAFATNLFGRYKSQIDRYQDELKKLDDKIALIANNFYLPRFSLMNHHAWVNVQYQMVCEYLANPSPSNQEQFNVLYRQKLEQVLEDNLAAYNKEISQRDDIILEDKPVLLIDPLRQKLLDDMRLKLRSEMQGYLEYEFNLEANLQEVKSTLAIALEAAMDELEKVLKQLEYALNPVLTERSKLEQQAEKAIRELQKQQTGLKQSTYHPTLLESYCQKGLLSHLRTFLSPYETREKKLLVEKIAPNALIEAICHGQVDVCAYLLREVKISANGWDQYTGAGLTTHYTPLHYLAQCHLPPALSLQFLALFKEHTANIFEVDSVTSDFSYGRTPLHTAALVGNYCVAHWLIQEAKEILGEGTPEFYAYINQSEAGFRQRNTPLHNAAYQGHWHVANLLILSGADPKIKNKSGSTMHMEIISSKLSLEEKIIGFEAVITKDAFFSDKELRALTKLPQYEEDILPVLERLVLLYPERYQLITKKVTEDAAAGVFPLAKEKKSIILTPVNFFRQNLARIESKAGCLEVHQFHPALNRNLD